MLEPHGLGIGLKTEILDKDGRVISTDEQKGKLEGWINLENPKTKQKLIVPARSLINNFINCLYYLLAGSSKTYSAKRKVAWGASASSGSVARQAGILLGTDDTPVTLGDNSIAQGFTEASQCIPKETTFTHPNFSGNRMSFEVRRLFSNASSGAWVIQELGVMAKKLVIGSMASNGHRLLVSRDRSVYGFAGNSDLRAIYKFILDMNPAIGGGVLNLVRLIYNIFFRGDQNYSASKLISKHNVAQTYTYGSGGTNASTGSSSPFYVVGSAGHYIGLVVGRYSSQPDIDNINPTPDISADETTFSVNHTNLTVSANTLNAVSNPFTGISQFSLTRDFTNNHATQVKYIDRYGILIKGSSGGTSMTTDQSFIVIAKPADGLIGLQPGQTYRITVSFSVEA